MEFVRIFWKNNFQEAYLPKMNISGQIVSEIVARLYPVLRKLHTNPSSCFLSWPQKNLEGFVWSFLSISGLWSQRQFAPKCSFLASRPLGHCSFRISWQIPCFQKFHFYDVITLVLYCTDHQYDHLVTQLQTKNSKLSNFMNLVAVEWIRIW